MSKKCKLLSELIDEGRQITPIPSKADYNFCNYCSTCALKYSKNLLRCKECNQKLRTKPWHRSKISIGKELSGDSLLPVYVDSLVDFEIAC